MMTFVWMAGLPFPFRVKGEPQQVRDELLKHGGYIEGEVRNADTTERPAASTQLMRYSALVQFEHAEKREPVYINPDAVAAITGPETPRQEPQP